MLTYFIIIIRSMMIMILIFWISSLFYKIWKYDEGTMIDKLGSALFLSLVFGGIAYESLFNLYLKTTCNLTMEPTTCCIDGDVLLGPGGPRQICTDWEPCEAEACVIGGEAHFVY